MRRAHKSTGLLERILAREDEPTRQLRPSPCGALVSADPPGQSCSSAHGQRVEPLAWKTIAFALQGPRSCATIRTRPVVTLSPSIAVSTWRDEPRPFRRHGSECTRYAASEQLFGLWLAEIADSTGEVGASAYE
eukprot:4989168-Prymnesium_polylepis.1